MEKIFSRDMIVKAADDGTVEFIASKEVADRDREIVTVKGIDIKNYKKNPVVLWAHDRSQPPIGKAVKITKSKDELKIKVDFADEETYPFASTIYKLLKGGYLNAVSIGFIPDYKAIEYDEKKEVRIFNKVELFELSVVPVPANQEALATGKTLSKALEDNVIDEEEFKSLVEVEEEEKPSYEDLEARIVGLEEKIKDIEALFTKTLNEEDTNDNYFDELFKEFNQAGGQEPNTETNDLNDLLDEYFED